MERIEIFYDDDLQIEIIDVFRLNREKCRYHTPKRPFHILTKRLSGYTDIMFQEERLRITANDLLYIPANVEYTRQSYGAEEIIAIHFNILNKNLFEPFLITVKAEPCNKAFHKIYRLWSEKASGFKYKCTAVLYAYLSTVMIKKNRSEEYKRLEKSIHYIQHNLTQKLSVTELAKMSNLCETQYRKMFKNELGVPPVKYINKLRINRAVSMLNSGYYTMAEISELCGFSEQKYFNRVFKTETGASPSEYKNISGVAV